MADLEDVIAEPDELVKRRDSRVIDAQLALNDLAALAGELVNSILLAELLASIRDIKADAARAYSEVERFLLAAMGERKIEVPGVGLVESKKRTKRTAWRHDELIPVVVARALD